MSPYTSDRPHSPAEELTPLTLRELCDQQETIKQEAAPYIDWSEADALRDQILRNDPDVLRDLEFSAAGKIWLATRKPYLRPRTFVGHEQHVKSLGVFFGGMPLRKIHIGQIRMFQSYRTVNHNELWTKPAGPSYINHEVNTLQMILDRAGEWKKIEKHYEPLPLPRWKPPKVMSDEEEMMLFSVASSNPSWALAFWVCAISVNTGASGTELRHMRIRDVHLEARLPFFSIDAETAKEGIRGRVVQLNGTAQIMVKKCLQRAAGLGSVLPEHHVFPFRRAPGHWSPDRPTTASWLRRSFDELRIAAGLPWITPHCFRHQHITLSYENNEDEAKISLRVGHTSTRMTRWYLSARSDQQRSAVDAIDPMTRFGAKSNQLDWLKELQKTC